MITEYKLVLKGWPYSVPLGVSPLGADTDTDPAPGEMHVLMNEGKPEMINFLCPCGCGRTCPTHVVTMKEKANSNPEQQSTWKDHCWGFDLATLTVMPSIRYLNGCKSHFNIENGKVKMHAS